MLLLTLLCLALSALHSGEATKCYVCTSANDPKCADPFMPDAQVKTEECTPDLFKAAGEKLADIGSALGFDIKSNKVDSYFVCSKVNIGEGDNKVTFRSCSLPVSDKLPDPCKELIQSHSSSNNNVPTYCSLCDSDLCNSASALPAVLPLLLAATAFLFMSK